MNDDAGAARALLRSTTEGTLAQVAMVVAGHYIAAIAALFGILGMLISLVVGTVYATRAAAEGGGSYGGAAGGGAVAGGACALIGIVVSHLLGDVTAIILVFGTLSSAVTGALGGLLGRRLAGRTRQASAGGVGGAPGG